MASPDTSLKLTTPSDREILITREFDAPRAMVFDCLSKPELLKRWLGTLDGWTWAECEIDFTVGGAYRYLWRGPEGMEIGIRGVYLEIVVPERIVSTEAFDQSWYPGSAVGTVTLVERDGTTTLTTRMRYDSRESRDAVIKSPMDKGMEIGYRALDRLLSALPGEAGN